VTPAQHERHRLEPVALSVRQPWAWAIVSGYKDVENRSWPTNYRGTYLSTPVGDWIGLVWSVLISWVMPTQKI
jgi:ASCH domain